MALTCLFVAYAQNSLISGNTVFQKCKKVQNFYKKRVIHRRIDIMGTRQLFQPTHPRKLHVMFGVYPADTYSGITRVFFGV